ncbi:hypothetical protein D1007_49002 [Hordeum vulgare]|nr:hypothetical protein D1007_49002 [Hordeum vulgare]
MSSISSTIIIEALSPQQALVPPTEPTDPLETECSMDQELPVSKIPLKRKGKMKLQVDTSNLRRSLRSNKYDGFKIPSMAEGKITKSKVKPRMIPNIALQEVERAPTLEVPPPTSINTMQAIGT